MWTVHQIIWMINEDEVGSTCRTLQRAKNLFTKFQLESLKGRDHLQDRDSKQEGKIKVNFKELGGVMWLGHIWLKTGSGGGLLWTLLKAGNWLRN